MTSFGIDFGTTNCAAVKMASGAEPQKYGDETGRPMPSIVAIDIATGEMKGGRHVWEHREFFAESPQYHLVPSVKWKLGTDEVWQTERGVLTPEDVASFILKSLSARAFDLGLEPIRQASITIPYNYPSQARISLRRAAAKAGIEISTFITESTAALMRYLPDLRHCRNVAVFDWGGGTLDISILQIRDESISELATDGMELAGDYIDSDLARALHLMVMEQRKEAAQFESMSARDRDILLTQSERAKCRFETLPGTDIALTSYGGAPATLRSLERPWFESIIAPHVELAIDLLARTIDKAGLSPDAINRLLVIGGSAKLRLLHERLRHDPRFEAALYVAKDAEWDVALGAAALQLAAGGYELSESLGIVLSDNSYYEILPPGSRISDSRHSLTVFLVEDARQANIAVAHRQSPHKGFETILRFGVETLGFDLEPIHLRYWVSPDLVFTIEAESVTFGTRSLAAHDYGKLRFSYHI